MPSTVVFLSINGIEQNLEVDLESACFAEVAEAFDLRALKRAGSTVSPRLAIKAVLPKDNDGSHRFALEGEPRESAATRSDVGAKLDELTDLIRDLPGRLALADSSQGRLSQQWTRPRTTNGGYEKEPTEEELEAFLLGDRSMPGSRCGGMSHTGSRANLAPDSPPRASANGGGEFNETLQDAQKLIAQLSDAADKEDAAAAAVRSVG